MAKPARRRHVKKNIEPGVTYIHTTSNSTIVMITDMHGSIIAWSSVGALGSKGSRKSTPPAAQMVAKAVVRSTQEHGSKTAEVTVKGPGSGCESAARTLATASPGVTSVRDVTPVLHSGTRPSERRRV